MTRPRKEDRSPTPATRIPESREAVSPSSGARRRWWFRLAALIFLPLLALGGLEGALRLAGYGYPTAFFLHREIREQSVLTENRRFGWRFFGAALARTPRPMVASAVKPASTCRIFVFGESAAYGDPRPDFGLPRILEVLLRERFPGARFEVINAAMTGINSHVILPIARDCARQNGDVWVIYMGNNEVVGPFGSGTVFGPRAPGLALIRASLALKATRTGELLGALLARARVQPGAPAEWEGLAMFLGHQVRPDDPRMKTVYSHFARNLADILEAGRSHGVKIVVSTVASNLKDCAPFASQHRLDLSASRQEEWERIYRAGVAAEAAGNPGQASEQFEKASQMDDSFADLQFRWGRCCRALGRDDKARRHFVLAREDDALRFRADSRLNDLVRQAAAGREAEGIRLADAEEIFARNSPHGLPGEELFYDHVHPNFDGNYLLARSLADQVLPLLPEAVTRTAGPAHTWLARADCARRLAWTDWERYQAARSVMLRLAEPPFTAQLDHAQQYQRWQRVLEQLLPATTPAALRQAAGVCRAALAQAPEDWVLQHHAGELSLKLGDLPAAERAYRQVTELLPFEMPAFLELGLLLIQENRADEALREFQSGLRLQPDSVPLRNAAALALIRLGKPPEALAEYERALRTQPDSFETHLNLGTLLESLGRKEEAAGHFRQARQRDLNNPEALLRLGNVCLAHGWVAEAVTNLAKAVRLDPTDISAQVALGGALDAAGRRAEAQQRFAEAVRLNPGHAGARVNLGVELLRQGQEAAAVAQFTEAVRLQPDFLTARLNLGMALLRQRKNAEARRQFEEALRIEPGNAVARKYLEATPQE